MARVNKQGVDYFPLNVNLDNKFKYLQAKHGLIGFAVTIKLFQHVYAEGYWVKFGEDEIFMFASENKIEIDTFKEILATCMDKEIFSSDLYEKFGILTSHGIQKQFKEMAKRRKEVEIVSDYLLIADMMSTSSKHNASKSTQIEIEREIETETETESEIETDTESENENEHKKSPTPKAKKAKHGQLGNVLLTPDELRKLEDELGKEKAEEYIRRLDEYIGSSGKKYKSHYATILTWRRNDRDSPKQVYSKVKDTKQEFKEREYDYSELEKKLLGGRG